ncbi:high osmolarity signaling protein SHO1 [Microthyrium microscopicum]|uniref:High osmolarity signaling protein SHO1 n=1 Tax=Microthyrium microscopicum TaxID=703497 RepID=A0A6A6US48_9PEZI|nr:high osmolarity signaling protein SHO1 [Microthyrium microscopicum]
MERYNETAARFDLSRIIGDPFALATISIAILAWLIAFISSIYADVKDQFPNFAWWALVFMFLCILAVTISVATETEDIYSVAIVGYLSAGVVLTASAVNSLIYTNQASKQASASGFILLSMVSMVWIAYFGAKPQAGPRKYIDSFALHKSEKSFRASRGMSNAYGSRSDAQQPQMYTSAQLNGFETSSPVSGFPGGPVGAAEPQRNSAVTRFGAANGTMTSATTGPAPTEAETNAPMEYPYKAKAIYSYEANPDDANEISFGKHEVLEVSDVSGRWWQAKKENGETGIAPSNYLVLL